jgi:enterochelin esterase-like enzyme
VWGSELSKLRQHPAGQIVRLELDSRCLSGNLLGDPTRRTLPVYLPPGYDDEPSRRYPVGFYLAGFLGTGHSQLNWKPWAEGLPARLDRLIGEGQMGPMIVAFPDCFTAMGGSQYINSSYCGNYDDYLNTELVPLVDASFRCAGGSEHRAVFGKSSGGFGALVQGMLHPETWGALACHSGDSYFEFCFLTDLPKTLNEIAKHGSIHGFLETFFGKKKRSAAETHAIMHLAMAACFDPQPDHPDGFELPVDLQTGRLRPSRWERWLSWDPVRMIPKHLDSLGSLRLLFIDCGSRDQYHLQYGARQMSEELRRHGVEHVYEEFPDNHSSVDYRMDVSLPQLYQAISEGLG